jgi:alkanesulfonate monooxygenase SsuD/methylene tetrahydromethanopterin reductase-like flavin-dependent oxidoreductase (luciferase family)
MANHGTVFETRFALICERIEAMKAIWTNDVAEYRGTHVNLEPLWCWPKPVQKPHPPIMVGGGFPQGARRAIAYGDGWMPQGRNFDALAVLPRYRQMVAEAARDPDCLPVSVFGAPHDAELLKGYSDARIERTIFILPTAARELTLKNLDVLAAVVRRVV